METAKKPNLFELDFIRSISCVAVVVMHAIDSNNYRAWLPELEKLALFATPAFLFLAAFLLFYSYPHALPARFFGRRLAYILVPYLIWSSIYTLVGHLKSRGQLPPVGDVIQNALTGQYHIYFILIVFQFYVLFVMLKKLGWAQYLAGWKAVAAAFVFNILYLLAFKLTSAPLDSLVPFWRKTHWLLFPAWIFYFVLGSALAVHYDTVKAWLIRHRYWLYLMVGILGAVVLILVGRPVTSKRWEIVVYTAAVLPALFAYAWSLGRCPRWLQTISRYSFGIYLAHPLFYRLTSVYYSADQPWLFFAQAFIVQFAGAFLLVWAVSRLPLGAYIVGKVKRPKRTSALSGGQAAHSST